MAGTNLGFPFDAEVFNYSWKNTPDLELTTMINSGAVVQDAEIANLISNGSNFFTTPYYNVLGGDEDVYNGVSEFEDGSLTGGSYSGVVYGRMKKWSVTSFIKDFNSGADPMAQIVAGVANYYIKKRQARLIKIIDAVMGVTGDADMALHTTDIAHVGSAQAEQMTCTSGGADAGTAKLTITSAYVTGSPLTIDVTIASGDDTADEVATAVRTAINATPAVATVFTVSGGTDKVILTKKVISPFDTTFNMVLAKNDTLAEGTSTDATASSTVGDANKIGATTIEDACVTACGDNAQGFSLSIMHSVVANRLASLQLLDYSKYTDPTGITRNLPIATINGKTVIINDNVTVVNSPVAGYKEYATYVLGAGALRYASAPVDVPSELDRDPNTNGGTDMIYTRIREAIVPYGFSFVGDASTDVGIPDATLYASASYERKMPAKSIMMVKLVTNG